MHAKPGIAVRGTITVAFVESFSTMASDAGSKCAVIMRVAVFLFRFARLIVASISASVVRMRATDFILSGFLLFGLGTRFAWSAAFRAIHL